MSDDVAIEHYGERRSRCWFNCPRRSGKRCHVLLKPWPITGANTWDWDRNESSPTLSPSINCNGAGGCGWHGYVQQGKLVSV